MKRANEHGGNEATAGSRMVRGADAPRGKPALMRVCAARAKRAAAKPQGAE